MNKDLALLILSCDKYSDVWDSFFQFFDRYWPDCPYPVYLGTNELNFNHPKVTVIHSGPGKNWSADTRKILEQISEPFVLLLLEDYWIKAKPDTQILNKSLALMQKMDAGFLRLACFPSDHYTDYAYDKIPGEEWCGITRSSAKYRINLQAGIWKSTYFLELLKDGESAWDFEINGTERSRSIPVPVLGISETHGVREVHGPIPYLCTAVTKGIWMYDAIQLARKEKINVDVSKRPVESRYKWWRRWIYHRLPYSLRPYLDFLNRLFK